ncbi:hypothetical protein CC78DRAFT_535526 [Lojkania enalia]|uniref:Uncharacterized protein n=1 Tax=Lojkania enalia TaxID=147567 RepID=A0A9P4K3Y4_9PLEO|nr:hypothetical protein CC78DRAFT_535526 [Didymosphaeria enalia]
MSTYQHLFSTNAVLNVWRNLRRTREQNDFLLTFHCSTDDASKNARFAKGHVDTAVKERNDGRRVEGRSIGFVVPWRSMQAQRREIREREREVAEVLVVLAGEVAFTDLSPSLQASLSHNPLIQIRHLAAGLSRQLSRIELQMADNLPFARGKNLYTGGEIARKFLPPIRSLFQQRPVPQRMILELLMELKDLVYAGMAACDAEVLEWEVENFSSFVDLDEGILRCLTCLPPDSTPTPRKSLFNPRQDKLALGPWLLDHEEILYHLESLETTAAAMSHLTIPDFTAKSIIELRRMLDRRTLNEFSVNRKRRMGICAEYARCMKWAGTSWRHGGGCRRGCKNEDEDPEGLPSWHSTSRHFDKAGTYSVNGKVEEE